MAHHFTQEEREERVRQLTDKLEAGISELFQSDQYASYLATMAKFHHYSFKNALLIFLQCPSASCVAGFHDWNRKFNRHVKKGERGIKIFAPCPCQKPETRLDADTGLPVLDAAGHPVTEWVRVNRYKIVTVFDISQTEGEDLPEIGTAELTGSVAGFERMVESLQALSPLPVSFEDFPGDSHGYCDHMAGQIVVRSGLSQKQTLKTLVHEIAHAKLHANEALEAVPKKSRSTKELEAESVAYVVCQHFGIDTSDYSFGYVAGWSRDKNMEQLKASLDLIRSTSAGLIAGIESREKVPEQKKMQRSPRRIRRQNAMTR